MTPPHERTTWPTRSAAALELSKLRGERITVRTLKSWKAQGAPLPPGGAIPKAELVAWLENAKRRPGEHGGGTGLDPEATALRIQLLEEQVRKLKNYNEKVEHERLDRAEVMNEIDAATISLRDWLQGSLPALAYDLSVGKERIPALEQIRQTIIDRCNQWADDAKPDGP